MRSGRSNTTHAAIVVRGNDDGTALAGRGRAAFINTNHVRQPAERQGYLRGKVARLRAGSDGDRRLIVRRRARQDDQLTQCVQRFRAEARERSTYLRARRVNRRAHRFPRRRNLPSGGGQSVQPNVTYQRAAATGGRYLRRSPTLPPNIQFLHPRITDDST